MDMSGMGGGHSDSSYSMQPASQSPYGLPQNYTDPAALLEWLKTNETVKQVMAKAKVGFLYISKSILSEQISAQWTKGIVI